MNALTGDLALMLERLERYSLPSTVALADAPQAAVLMPIICQPEPALLLTLRASGLSTHGGEVAFPGGRFDQTDLNLQTTALRESHEEVGLLADDVQLIRAMTPLVSRHGVHVTPFVGLIAPDIRYQPNEAEIAAVFNVPLKFFCSDPRQVTHRIDYLGQSWYIPCYQYGSYKIWGLTAMMIVELVNVLFDRHLDLNRPLSLSAVDVS